MKKGARHKTKIGLNYSTYKYNLIARSPKANGNHLGGENRGIANILGGYLEAETLSSWPNEWENDTKVYSSIIMCLPNQNKPTA